MKTDHKKETIHQSLHWILMTNTVIVIYYFLLILDPILFTGNKKLNLVMDRLFWPF